MVANSYEGIHTIKNDIARKKMTLKEYSMIYDNVQDFTK